MNRYAKPFLVGCKFDLFDKKKDRFKAEITEKARVFSNAMKAPLIYCSSSHSINIKTIFQLILASLFDLRLKVPEALVFFLGIFNKIYPFARNIPICKNGYISYTHFNIPFLFIKSKKYTNLQYPYFL